MKKIIILVGLVLVVVGIYYFTSSTVAPEGGEPRPLEDGWEEIADAEATKAAIQSNPAPLRYANTKYGFSFDKPEGYTVGALNDGTGDTLLVQRSSQSSVAGSQQGFQIYITELDEPLTLTPDLIQAELSGTTVVSPLAINLDGKAKGMMFSSNNENFGGKSYEIWFVKDNILYQITSYAEFATTLQKIIGTWKFE